MSPLEDGVIGAAAPAGDLADDPIGSGDGSTVVFGGLPDLRLGQLPDDIAPFEAPAFLLSRKEIEPEDAPLTGGPPLGSGGGQGPDPRDAATLGDAAAPGVDAATGVLSGAQHALGDAQSLLSGAQSAVNGIPAALDAAQAALSDAAANLPVLPPLPADPIGDLMKGLALPAIPGLDALFAPFLELISSFGTGVLGGLNPATLLSQGSQLIETAVQVGKGAFETVESAWDGKASDSAQAASQQAQAHGRETAQRGVDLSAVTEQAAAVVQRGNVQLTAIAQSFAAQATALAPVILAPPAQTALITSATEHLASAITVVNLTRGELAGYTAQVNGMVGELLGPGSGPDPAAVAKSLAQNVGQPILEQAKQLLEGSLNPASTDPGVSEPGTPTDPDTRAAALGSGGAGGGGLSAGGGPGGGSGLGSGGGIPSTPGAPGSSIPGGSPGAGAGAPVGAGGSGAPGTAGPGSPGFIGSPAAAAANRGGADQDHARAVQPYENVSGESELTGDLGAATPSVIGELDEQAAPDQSDEA
ncbi:hypothetical protein [Nocardia sp. NPDC057668]|uniref:hypothetical protein n=1 Tax=Nocardia sp. NPDC057668 TaxID=3346202 RepID=UPI00366E09B7